MENHHKPSKQSKSKRIVGFIILAFIVIVIISAVSNSGGNKTNSSNNNTATTTSSKTAKTQSATAATTGASASQPATRQVQGTAVTLGAGTFTGGKDVAPGLYDVTTVAGQSGNFVVNGGSSYNEILGDDGSGDGVSKIRVKVSAGDQIQISGMSDVTFTPVTAPFVTGNTAVTLYAGTFTVGQDVGAGNYTVTPGSGQSGNFVVNGGSSYNEILGTDSSMGEDPSLHVTLNAGDTIDISSMDQVVFTPSS